MYDWAATVITFFLGCLVVSYIGRRAFDVHTPRPLPPGPPGLPWVGNAFGIDTSAPWKTFRKWAEKYGDIVHSRVFGVDIIVIDSEQIAIDLLEKRSSNYSDRPHLLAADMCGLKFVSGLLPYGNMWRSHRRLFHQTFRRELVPRFLPSQHRRSSHLIQQLFDTPSELDHHLFEYSASVILNSTYGYDPVSSSDEFINMLAKAVEVLSIVAHPEVSLVASAFPLLFRLPLWLPGMSFAAQVEAARMFCKQDLERPFRYSLKQVASGRAVPSMISDALQVMEQKGISPDEPWMETLKYTSTSALLAASETSHAFLMTFFLMMMLNPAVQEKAQAQIDSVVGNTRLPTVEDRPLLPFVDAIMRETVRCHPLAPLVFPHVVADDDVYNGFHIPKGAIILVNVWSIAHDESRYPNPQEFMPERFLNDDGSLKPNDVEHIAFGFGRRICAGRHFADTSVWTVMAKVLAVFKILKPLDEHGVEIPVEPRFSGGFEAHPLPFKYRIVPRFPGMDAGKLEQLVTASNVA